jgi:acetylserotonin N-methyltransferase
MDGPARILDLVDGFRVSKTLFAAVELGLFDGARPPGAAASRLLDACVSLELLEKRGAEYVNTPLAEEYLRSSSPWTLAGHVRFTNRSLYRRWARLEDAVLMGETRGIPAWRAAARGLARLRRRLPRLAVRFGRAGLRMVEPAEIEAAFVASMHGRGLVTSQHVVAAFDLARFTRLVDLGGASGHLALAARERHPALHVCVHDRPAVIAVAREYVGERAELIAGDFFRDPLPPADLYVLGKVLHGCTPRQVTELLARIHAALPEGGGLLIAERLLDEDGLGPRHVLLSSLNMLVATGGRERTWSEYRALLANAGFRDIEHRKTGALLDPILAVK